jgi:hypothetical protein
MAGVYRPRHPEGTVLYKMLRIFFKYNRRLLGELCRCALRSLTCYFEVLAGSELVPGVIAAILTFGDRINVHLHLHFLVTEGGAERLLSWRHTGFSVHSRVRAKTKKEAERVGKYMIRPLLSLGRLSLDEREGQVGYRYGKDAEEVERMDYLEFIARTTSHIPDKGQVTVRYYGLYANAPIFIDHLNLTFVADRPPPPRPAFQEYLMAAETSAEYFS